MAKNLHDLYKHRLHTLDLSVDDRKQVFSIGSKIQKCFWDYNDNKANHKNNKIRNLYSFIDRYITCSSNVSINARTIKRFVSEFTRINKEMPISGVVLLNKDKTKVMLVRNYKSRSWSFPKGKIEVYNNEKPIDCAYRECLEETNYDCSKNRVLGKVSEHICGRMTYFYIVDGVPEDYKFSCDNPYEIEELAWHDFNSRLNGTGYNIYINLLYDRIKTIVEKSSYSKVKLPDRTARPHSA